MSDDGSDITLDQTLKITIVGDKHVGKTAMLRAFTSRSFPQIYEPTVYDTVVRIDGVKFSLSLWDTTASDDGDLQKLRHFAYPNTDCFIVCYLLNDKATYYSVENKWIPELQHHCPHASIVLTGPLRIPLLGNMVQIVRSHPSLSHLAFDKLAKDFGSMMRLRVGFQDMVVISDFDVMKDMLKRDVFCGRHFEGYMKSRSFGKELGVIFTSGDTWKTLRKFTVRNLRDFGFGRRDSMKSTVVKELDTFVDHLKHEASVNNGIIRVDRLFHISLLNVLWGMVGGSKFSHDDPKLLHLLKINEDVMRTGNFGANLAFAFPFLAHWLPNFYIQKRVNGTFQRFIKGIFADYRQRGHYLRRPRNFIDVCLAEMDNNARRKDSCFTEEQFIITIQDLFQVGSETTGNTLAYALLFMMQNPSVQEKAFQEIDSKFPDDELPKYEDRERLPYTEATMLEVLRKGSVVPLPPPRKSMCDTMYRNYFFPKDCIITANFHSMLMDENFWGDPEKFRPERFLPPSSCIEGKRERVEHVFGFGKRVCLGETLAMTTLFLYFSALIKNFSFHPVSGEEEPSLEPVPGFILSPQPYNIIFRPRN